MALARSSTLIPILIIFLSLASNSTNAQHHQLFRALGHHFAAHLRDHFSHLRNFTSRMHNFSFHGNVDAGASTSHANTGECNNATNKTETNTTVAAPPGVPISKAREFLIAHNMVRTRFGEPPMKWSRDLARYSRRFATKRAVDCQMIHSDGPYGENIFWGAQNTWNPTQVVEFWAGEEKYFDSAINDCIPGQMCGHYTQVVWRDSVRLGCATVTCLDGGMFAICSYDPPGNYVHENPFTPGE